MRQGIGYTHVSRVRGTEVRAPDWVRVTGCRSIQINGTHVTVGHEGPSSASSSSSTLYTAAFGAASNANLMSSNPGSLKDTATYPTFGSQVFLTVCLPHVLRRLRESDAKPWRASERVGRVDTHSGWERGRWSEGGRWIESAREREGQRDVV